MMKQPHLRLVPEDAQPEPSVTEPLPGDRVAILKQMHQLFNGQAEVTLGLDRSGEPFVNNWHDGLADREEVEAMRLFLDLYLEVFPDERTIAHSNNRRCAMPDCEHCLSRELAARLEFYWHHVCVLKRSVQAGEVALVQVGDIYKVVASKDMSARLRGIERQSQSTVRCLHRIRTNDQHALKYLWLHSFAFFLCRSHEDFSLPVQAIEHFKARSSVEIERDSRGDVDVPDSYQPQSFGVPMQDYPALRLPSWHEPF